MLNNASMETDRLGQESVLVFYDVLMDAIKAVRSEMHLVEVIRRVAAIPNHRLSRQQYHLELLARESDMCSEKERMLGSLCNPREILLGVDLRVYRSAYLVYTEVAMKLATELMQPQLWNNDILIVMKCLDRWWKIASRDQAKYHQYFYSTYSNLVEKMVGDDHVHYWDTSVLMRKIKILMKARYLLEKMDWTNACDSDFKTIRDMVLQASANTN